MENIKLVNLKEDSFYFTSNYIEAIKYMIDVSKVRDYIETQTLVAFMNYSEQLHIYHVINYYIKVEDSSEISEQILHIVLMISPLHVSLNICKTVFLTNYKFFDKFFYEIFRHQKVLVQKPKLYKINLILELMSQG